MSKPEIPAAGASTAILRGPLPFEEGDPLPLRRRDVQQLFTLVSSRAFRCGILWGESGCGKSSLLRAGLVPMLRDGGFLPVYVATPTKDPCQAIAMALRSDSPATGRVDPKALLQVLVTSFDTDELRLLCFDQGIDFEELRGDTKTAKAIALVLHSQRHGGIVELSQAVRRARPQASLPDAATSAALQEPSPDSQAAVSPGAGVLQRLRDAAPAAKVVVILDQFEQFFLENPVRSAQEGLFAWLRTAVADTSSAVVFLVSIQASVLGRVQRFLSDLLTPGAIYQLQNFDARQAAQLLAEAADTDHIAFDAALIDAVVRDLERQGSIRPGELQLVATRLKVKNIYSLDRYVPPLLPRVLVIVYNPVVDQEGQKTLIDALGWNDPDILAAEYIQDIQECSDGLVLYQIVERDQYIGRIELDAFPIQAGGFQYKPQDYLRALQGLGARADLVDYEKLIEEFNLLQRIASREFDEVWLFGFPYAGFYQSTMAGKGAFWCNSPPVAGTDGCPRRFLILGFNYERRVGEMLEALGHQAESIMERVYRHKKGEGNLWKRFTRYDKVAPGQAHVGTIHYAPNSLMDYDWGNMTPVRSFCDDWYRFPHMTGTVRMVDATEWGNGDIRAHHKWWLRHLPRAAGTTDGIANNWWRYIVDPNNVD